VHRHGALRRTCGRPCQHHTQHPHRLNGRGLGAQASSRCRDIQRSSARSLDRPEGRSQRRRGCACPTRHRSESRRTRIHRTLSTHMQTSLGRLANHLKGDCRPDRHLPAHRAAKRISFKPTSARIEPTQPPRKRDKPTGSEDDANRTTPPTSWTRCPRESPKGPALTCFKPRSDETHAPFNRWQAGGFPSRAPR